MPRWGAVVPRRPNARLAPISRLQAHYFAPCSVNISGFVGDAQLLQASCQALVHSPKFVRAPEPTNYWPRTDCLDVPAPTLLRPNPVTGAQSASLAPRRNAHLFTPAMLFLKACWQVLMKHYLWFCGSRIQSTAFIAISSYPDMAQRTFVKDSVVNTACRLRLPYFLHRGRLCVAIVQFLILISRYCVAGFHV